MMFILVTEDGVIFKSEAITENDRLSCDAGILDIIDTDGMRTYYENQWHELEEWDNQ